MITMLIFDQSDSEITSLIKLSREVVALEGNEKLNIVCNSMEVEEPAQLAIVNVCDIDGIYNARQLRKEFPSINIMLIADASISPMSYLNPEIRPISLIIAPYGHREVREVLTEFISSIMVKDEGSIWIDTPEGKAKLFYRDILYLEARNKMICIRLNSVEYSIYGSLSDLEERLPDTFIRCHRGFIINRSYIDRVRLSENYIMLNKDIRIPLSRTYKDQIRELVRI